MKITKSKIESSPSAVLNVVIITLYTTGDHKDIGCIRVDGSADEDPVHEEVQYWWTRRHLETKSLATLASTRNSGRSFKNRVELQNGCLALEHANTFIPSTLNGSCTYGMERSVNRS